MRMSSLCLQSVRVSVTYQDATEHMEGTLAICKKIQIPLIGHRSFDVDFYHVKSSKLF
jgi:hypothetical protein